MKDNHIDSDRLAALVNDIMDLTKLENGSTVYQVIEVIAEAVREEPASAVREARSVTAANNTITAAPRIIPPVRHIMPSGGLFLCVCGTKMSKK